MKSKLNLNNIMLGSKNPKVLAEFYEKVLEKKPDMVEDGDWYGFTIGSMFLSIGSHSEVTDAAGEPQRIIMNFATNEVKEEFARLKALGAKVIAEPYEMQGALIATLADTDGNYFQLMTPWKN